MNWFLHALRHYADFSGRARRMEYWMYLLVYFLIYGVLLALQNYVLPSLGGILVLVYALALIIPGISVSVRRLHDTGHSGWWFLIGLTGIGWFVLLYWYLKDGDPGSNAYGPNPKGIMAAAPA